jgi:hypothetical protein
MRETQHFSWETLSQFYVKTALKHSNSDLFPVSLNVTLWMGIEFLLTSETTIKHKSSARTFLKYKIWIILNFRNNYVNS